MPIVSSIIVSDAIQKDGRRYVTERHTDHVGVSQDVLYLSPANGDATATMTARITTLETQLADTETNNNERRAYDQLSPVLIHSTAAQFRARIRERFRTATGWDAVRLGKFVNSLSLTDAQLKALFGVNDAQLPALKTKLANAATKYDSVATEAGQ